MHSNTWNHLTFLTKTELFEIEPFLHLAVCKQKTGTHAYLKILKHNLLSNWLMC